MTPPADPNEDYLLSHISPEPPELHEVWRRTHLQCVYPRMCSGHLQGRLLRMIAAMVRPHRIIELGAFTGYSAMALAEGMPEGAELHTIEADDEIEDTLRANIATSPRAADIHVHIGDALEVLPTLGGEWELAFIDANKRHYVEYLEALLPQMAPGAFILADNTLWGGKLPAESSGQAMSAHKPDAQTAGIMAFNDYVATHPRLHTVILPLRDGLTLLQLK
ncbi:MAG: O-methyltransferase [Candidatus Amulumruptor caecigallinarius]|nr:O-methyltransferase [Candidatus Amulumruptor caecigallinarius]MCM1397754.1 O-methyltransferase [Candidatus Amulumruptor caecigallinarius]MCM1454793.1 O-methyltransferase [bacterium]